jgi:uncharacterized protein (TIGR02453 family)
MFVQRSNNERLRSRIFTYIIFTHTIFTLIVFIMQPTPLLAFLAELAKNNNKAWFDEHRPRYEALRKEFTELVEDVIAGVAAFDPPMHGVHAKDAMFRINRDVRFSANKDPYKTQFSAALCAEGKKTDMPAYYFQIDHTGELWIGGGMYMPDPQHLRQIRENIAATPERVESVLADRAFTKTYGGLDTSMTLTKLPKGYYDDVPHPELIKLKGYFAGTGLASAEVKRLTGDALVQTIVERFRALHPLVVWLREAVQA